MSRLSNSKITDMLFSVRQHKRDVQKTTKYVELIIVADNREVGLQTEGLTEIVVQDKLKTFFRYHSILSYVLHQTVLHKYFNIRLFKKEE